MARGSSRVRTKAQQLVSRALASSARAAPFLLPHVSLLLALVGGAGMATAARLKWDPSTYIAVRELFPTEYRVAAATLCAASFTVAALGHLAALALAVQSPSTRRALLLTYAVTMSALVVVEVAWAAWSATRLVAWVRAQPDLLSALQSLKDYMSWVEFFLSALPDNLQALIKEARDDVPRNLYAGAAGVVLVAVLQPAAVLLALLAAARRLQDPAGVSSTAAATTASSLYFTRQTDTRELGDKKTPLEFVFKKGKLVSV